MSLHRVGREETRERGERDARFFAWDVPGDAHIVALVHDVDDAERSATVADAIATSVARRREHTLLLSAVAGPSPLDELLGGARSEGLPAALRGRARLTDVAIQRGDRPFVYIPGGSDPQAIRSLFDDDLLASFVERVRERGGTLFIVLSEAALLSGGLRSLLDGYVALGDVTLPADAKGLRAFGRIRFEESVGELAMVDDDPTVGGASAASESAPADPGGQDRGDGAARDGGATAVSEAAEGLAGPATADGGSVEEIRADRGSDLPAAPETAVPAAPARGWARHRKAGGVPVRPIASVLAAVGALVAGWWLLADAFAGDGPATEVSAPAGLVETTPSPSFDEAAAALAFDATPVLAYSVAIASYADRGDAEERLTRLAAGGGSLFFVSPTPVRGVIYHRVLAGALAERAAAEALMRELVASGRKDVAAEWDVRPASLAFDLGVFGERAAAEERVASLHERDVPAYLVSAPVEGGAVWRVYGGAYETERASEPMAGLIAEAGEEPRLIDRRGTDAKPSNQ